MYKKIYCMLLIIIALIIMISNISLAGYNTIDEIYSEYTDWKEDYPNKGMDYFASQVANGFGITGSGIPTLALTAISNQNPEELEKDKRNLWYELAGAIVDESIKQRNFSFDSGK